MDLCGEPSLVSWLCGWLVDELAGWLGWLVTREKLLEVVARSLGWLELS
jgi:hypothetical protein